MTKIILILSQDCKNLSVTMLQKSFEKQIQSSQENYQILIWDIHDVTVTACGIKLKSKFKESTLFSETVIPFSYLAFVIKRTWGPIRTQALSICEKLEKAGVPILNGCQFIKWTHSKIEQYNTLKDTKIFPTSVCFDKSFMLSIANQNIDGIAKKILKHMYDEKLSFPIVFKTNTGCLGGGVFLIKSIAELKDVIRTLSLELEKNKEHEFKNGFLLQEFISTDEDENISNYYRINLINGEPQSAVRFQLKWQKSSEEASHQKIIDFEKASDFPVDLQFFDKTELKKIIDACPYKIDVIGIDVLLFKGKLYLLEYNDGPNISQIVNLGNKYHNKSCINFPDAIAKFCFEEIKLLKENYSLLHSKL